MNNTFFITSKNGKLVVNGEFVKPKLFVFLRVWWRRKSAFAELKLRLALSVESTSDGFP